MKRSLKPLFFLMILLGCMSFAQSGLGQAPPPPPSEKGSNNNNAPGGGAPIDAGVYTALAMVAGFGAWKLFKMTRDQIKINR